MKNEIPEFTAVDVGLIESESVDDSPGTIEFDDPRSILKRAPPLVRQGEVLAKLSHSAMFVYQDEEVDALAAAMDKAPSLIAVGVVDETSAPVG